MAGLSVAYITFNAARCFADSLASVVDLTDDIVVVDSGSTDDTLAIAARFGARTQVRDWPGFGPQKQFAVEQARHDWVLVLDADEVLLAPAVATIKEALIADDLPVGFLLPRYNFFHGKRVRFGDWGKDRVLRLINPRRGQFSNDAVHEHWMTDGPVRRLNAPIGHYSFENYKAMLAKLDRYSDLNARGLLARGHVVGHREPMLHALAAFLRGYVLRLGFLDGSDGAGIALTTALGSFLKYAKALELQQASLSKTPAVSRLRKL
ncbi:MAG TPA: glycosyltransferase family 2 protein [Acidiferrobacter sp.]|nr:glycosyltransferase family 2 protein [Acidiferrobacter sp.]